MTKLNDMQLVLLTSAAKRDSGSLLPAPTSIAEAGDRLSAALTSLHELAFAEEGPAKNAKMTWRTDDQGRNGLFITEAGRAAIHVEPSSGDGAKATRPAAPPTARAERQTKSATVVELLRRSEGATLAEMVAATGWLPHTTRAALTGLRKKGFSLEKNKRGDETCYRVTAEA